MHSVPHACPVMNLTIGFYSVRMVVSNYDLLCRAWFFHFLFYVTECGTRLFLEVVFIFLQQVPPASFMLPGCTAVVV